MANGDISVKEVIETELAGKDELTPTDKCLIHIGNGLDAMKGHCKTQCERIGANERMISFLKNTWVVLTVLFFVATTILAIIFR